MSDSRKNNIEKTKIKLTRYSHGAGCGCKISPAVLKSILNECKTEFFDEHLLVGNSTLDDAAVYEIDDEKVIISTTDFFMPIVDQPAEFGAIAAVNAISDIYAMGGTPLMALAILCWPVNVLPAELAGEVLEGAKKACYKEGIAIAGGHSIDAPEPIFGLAVTGIANKEHILKNSTGLPGCELFLTKPLGIGILTTAMKKDILEEDDRPNVMKTMLKSNSLGRHMGKIPGVKAMTDVTGFGLLGHLIELCEGSGLSAEISFGQVPFLDRLDRYIAQKSVPGGTFRNYESYGHKTSPLTENQKLLLCDPQTSGGLLIAVMPESRKEFLETAACQGISPVKIGILKPRGNSIVEIKA